MTPAIVARMNAQTEPTVQVLADNLAVNYLKLQAARDAEREALEQLQMRERNTRDAQAALLNAREALDKATGVQPGMLGEAYVVDAQ